MAPIRSGPWPAVLVTAGGQFAAVASTTAVGVALPAIGRGLHAAPTGLEWIVNAYVVVYAGLLVAGGALGDRRGRKGLFMIGLAFFGLGALVAGLAPTLPVLLAGRVVQGLGPALLVPGSLTIIRSVFEDPRRRAVAIGLWSTSSGLALAAGPVLGGLVVSGLGWRWVFLVNAPLTAVLLACAGRWIPRIGRTPARTRFDWAGAALTTGAVAALAFALIEGRQRGWTSAPILAGLGGAVAGLAVFAVWERRRAEPLVDVRLFVRPAFALANAAGMAVFFSFVGAIVYFSAFFQQVQGHSPVRAGLDVCAIGAAFAVTAQLSGRVVARVGARLPMLLGLALGGAAVLGLLRLRADTGLGAVWWDFALAGAGIGLCLTPMTATAVGSVGAERAGMASAVHNAMRQLGQVLGVAVLGTLVYGGGGEGGRTLGAHGRAAFTAGLHQAVWVSGVALLGAAVLAAFLPRGGGSGGGRGGGGREAGRAGGGARAGRAGGGPESGRAGDGEESRHAGRGPEAGRAWGGTESGPPPARTVRRQDENSMRAKPPL